MSGIGKFRRAALCVLLAGMASAAPAQDVDDDSAKELQKWLARSFVLPPDLPLDPAVRAQAGAIAAAHLARMRTVITAWLREERLSQSAGAQKPSTQWVYFAVWARMLNELALWHITPGDAAYEKAMLDVATTAPAICRLMGDARFSDYASRILRVQALAPAQRDAVFASERSLLDHWGKPHPDIAPFPDPTPEETGMAVIERMRAGTATPPLALPPTLASSMVSARENYGVGVQESKCLFQQWQLRINLKQGKAPAAALSAFRYGTMITATDRIGSWFDDPDAAAEQKPAAGAGPSYPAMARRFQVTGSTVIKRTLDAAGNVVDARVASRKITVPGIRGVRPVAFENTFDTLARSSALLPGASASLPASQLVYALVWTLNDAPAKGPTP
jgi:hypothetical protein